MPTIAETPPAVRTGVVAQLRRFAVATTAGALAGFAIGGIGGRLAMLLLRLTSDPALHGLETDDGFTIGIVSSETGFLLTLTMILGAAGGGLYFLSRLVLTERSAPWVWGGLGATIGGTLILRPVGIDFTLLEPHLLAVVLFVAIPAAGAAATSALAERWLAREPRSIAWFAGLLPLVPFALIGPTAIFGLVVTIGIVLAVPAGWVRSRSMVPRAVVLAGRAALAAVGAYAAFTLAREVLEIL